MISIALMVIPMNVPPIHDTALLNDGAILCMYVCMHVYNIFKLSHAKTYQTLWSYFQWNLLVHLQ